MVVGSVTDETLVRKLVDRRRRRLPPGGRGRRAADPRPAGGDDRDQHRRHRDRSSGRRAKSGPAWSSRPRPRSTARTTACPCPRTTTGCSDPRRRAAGATRARRRSTSSWRWRTTASTGCRSPSSASSTRSDRARPAATAWSSRASSARRSTASPITVYGDGRQSRCFTDVEDTVRATIALSLAPAAVGEVFNVGTTHELTIGALAERVRALAGSDVADRARAVRRGLPAGVRGPAPPRAGHPEGGARGRLPAPRAARRDPPAGDRPSARHRPRARGGALA